MYEHQARVPVLGGGLPLCGSVRGFGGLGRQVLLLRSAHEPRLYLVGQAVHGLMGPGSTLLNTILLASKLSFVCPHGNTTVPGSLLVARNHGTLAERHWLSVRAVP
jgi:hypothetical protein